MDWGKAKNILIIAFLLVNLFLIYKVFLEDEVPFLQTQIADEQVIELKEQLRAHQVIYEGDIPTEIFDASYLVVQNYYMEAVTIAEFFLNDYVVERTAEEIKVEDENTGATIIQSEKGKTKINIPGGWVPDQERLNDDPILNREAAQQQVDALREKWELPENLAFYRMYNHSAVDPSKHETNYNFHEDELMTLKYYQEIEEDTLYGGYMKVHVSESGIVGIEFYFLESMGYMEDSIDVIPASTALLRLLDYMPDSDEVREITSIAFGYYTEEYLADEWEAVPVWRFELDEATQYYINAFTGELEDEGGI